MVRIRKYRALYLLLVPTFLWVTVFFYVPIYGVTMAFRTYQPSLQWWAAPWAKPLLYNFWFLKDTEFWRVMWNTFKLAGLKLMVGFPAPIILALLLNEVKHAKFKRVVQTVVYLPHFVSWVIFASIIYRLFDYTGDSPYNQVRVLFGLASHAALGEERGFLLLVLLSNVLKEAGWGTIIYLAAITGFDPCVYEAARIDGATRWQQIRFLTLPMLVPIIVLLLILSIPSLLSAGFDQIWNLKNPMVERVANITDIYVLRIGIQRGEYSYATALGLIFGLLGSSLSFAANALSKSKIGYGLW